MNTTPNPWVRVAPEIPRVVERAPSAHWHPEAVALFEFWRANAHGQLPPRRLFDPVDWRHVLPNVWMLDVVMEPFRLRFRLVGTGIVEQIRLDPTGRWLDEATPHLARNVGFMARYRQAVLERTPVWTIGPADIRPNNPVRAVENLTLPFASDGQTVDMLLMLSFFHNSA